MPGSRSRVRGVALVVAIAGLGACGGTGSPTTGGTLVRGAQVVDGSGSPRFEGSVRIADGLILEVGDLEPLPGERVVEAGGLVLTPGFIDTHSHHDRGLTSEPTARAAVSQGITTIVAGQDGGSPFPLADFYAEVDRSGTAVNVGAYVGHGTLRRSVLGDDYRRVATADEIDAMSALLEREMESGAFGLSTGLEYDPGIYATTGEVLALAEVVARAGGRYISHMRSEDRGFWEALEETIHIADAAGLPVQISHLKLAARSLWGRTDEVLARLDEARASGLDITADVYPYERWQSTMTVLFPERDFTDRAAARFALDELVAPEDMIIGRFAADPSLEGMSLARIARDRGTDAVTAYLDLIAESQAWQHVNGPGGESVVARSMTFEDIGALISWDHANVSSDGGLGGAHPRGFGAFTRVLGRYVREEGLLELEAAVRKMTSLAADHMGLDGGRGRIRPGAPADLVLLDPDRVIDRATMAEPHRPSEGIERVWVAGVVVFESGATTGALPGRVLRRSP